MFARSLRSQYVACELFYHSLILSWIARCLARIVRRTESEWEWERETKLSHNNIMRTVNFRSLTATHSKHEQYIYAQHGIYAHDHRTIEILFTDCDNKTRHTFLTPCHRCYIPKIESHHSLGLPSPLPLSHSPSLTFAQFWYWNSFRTMQIRCSNKQWVQRERETQLKRGKRNFANNFSVTSVRLFLWCLKLLRSIVRFSLKCQMICPESLQFIFIYIISSISNERKYLCLHSNGFFRRIHFYFPFHVCVFEFVLFYSNVKPVWWHQDRRECDARAARRMSTRSIGGRCVER